MNRKIVNNINAIYYFLEDVMKHRGFTLAEVLITLGIIGVVAAMTIPTLIANTNSQKYRAQFKKAKSKSY